MPRAGSLTELRPAVQTAVHAQDQLLVALTSASTSEQISRRRRRAVRAVGGPAQEARKALVSALAWVRSALPTDGDTANPGR